LLVNRKVPYNLIDRYLEVAIKKYNLQKGRFEFRNAEEDPVAEGEGNLKEFSPSGAGPSGGNYFQALASAWYNGAFDTGSLQKGIKSKEDVERLLQRGIVCPDGVTRKFGIDYNAEFDGVVISSDDYYEHSDHGKKPGTMIDVRTGQAWGPYDYMEFSDADLSESLTEFAPTKPPTAGAFGGNKDYGQPTSSRYIGGNKFVLGTTNNYVLTATVDKWGLEWDEDDEIWFLDSPGAAHIADATEGEIELPAPQEQRNQIHDLVTDYLNDYNSAELQRVAAYYGHSADGEMSSTLDEFALPGGDDREPDEEHILKQLAAQWWQGTEQQMARAQQTLAAMGWEIGQDESGDDDAGVFVIRTGDEHGDSYIAFPHSELSLDEGIRVPAQQILGTKNRAKSAYYPTNVKPKVPKLDKPLTDQELARLAQLAGIKSK
jgi:hypothetical protein